MLNRLCGCFSKSASEPEGAPQRLPATVQTTEHSNDTIPQTNESAVVIPDAKAPAEIRTDTAPSAVHKPESITPNPVLIPATDPEVEGFSSEPLSAFEQAIVKFRGNYEQFTTKNSKYIRVIDDVQSAIQKAGSETNVKIAADIFEKQIAATVEAKESKRKETDAKWTGKVANLNPLKWAADGLGVILQSLDNVSGPVEDFLIQLKRIEFQAARVAQNPRLDLNSDTTRDLMREKSVDLMTAIIEFFNSALIVFNRNFFGQYLNSIGNGSNEYESGKKLLDDAIKEYDQALFHLIAFMVAGSLCDGKQLILGLEYRLVSEDMRKQTDEFITWLSPSYWLVEAQLYNAQTHRGKDTLEWAYTMDEFRIWRNSAVDLHSKERILWIYGSLGIGKSIMAGYFIDLLKQLHPTPTVAYFFCKKGQKGLTTACDIIRTFAYQLTKDNVEACAVLEYTRSAMHGFVIDESLGVRFLFKKLLQEPLRDPKSDVYIILDGVDEADFTIRDVVEGKPEIAILIECLATLPFVRILFISRPNAAVSRYIKTLMRKSIGKNDNQHDIDTYVRETISERVKQAFANEGIDPFKYFSEKANSIFLWVVIVLEQLEKVKRKSDFQKLLNGFSQASGDMERLYTSVLSSFKNEDGKLVKEILKWLVVGARELTVEELKAAVEMSLSDELFDFADFLAMDCGAILRVVPGNLKPYNVTANDFSVQLIHETLRSYIVDREACHKDFYIDEEDAHCEVVWHCFNALCANDPNNIIDYAATLWAEHLIKLNTPTAIHRTLEHVYRFFHSNGCKRWMQSGPRDRKYPGSNGRFHYPEERYLQIVYGFLTRWSAFRQAGEYDRSKDTESENHITTTHNWGLLMLDKPWKLEEYAGKAAAELWLYEGMDGRLPRMLFWISLKHFCKIHRRSWDRVSDLQDIAENNFSCIENWIDQTSFKRKTCPIGLGRAFCNLRMWPNAVEWLRRATGELDQPELLGISYFKMCDYDSAIKIFENQLTSPIDKGCSFYFGFALRAKGEWDRAIAAFETNFRLHRGWPFALPYWYLGEMYHARGDYEKEIVLFRDVLSRSALHVKSLWWAWECIAEAYKALGDLGRAVRVYEDALEKGYEYWASAGLRLAVLEIDKLKSDLADMQDCSLRNKSRNKQQSTDSVHDKVNTNILVNSPNLRNSSMASSSRYMFEGEDVAGKWVAFINKSLGRQVSVSLLQTIELIGRVECIAFSPDGEYIATGGRRSAQIFHVESGRKVVTFSKERDIFTTECLAGKGEEILWRFICFSSDGRYIVTGGDDTVVKVWDVHRGGYLANRLQYHTSRIEALAVSPDGQYLASGSGDGDIVLWDFPSGTNPQKLLHDKNGIPRSMCFSPDSQLLAATFEMDKQTLSTVALWDTHFLTFAKFLPTGHSSFVSFSPYGKQLVTVSSNKGVIELWELCEMDGQPSWQPKPAHIDGKWFWRVETVSADICWAVLISGSQCHFFNILTGEPLFLVEVDSWCPSPHINLTNRIVYRAVHAPPISGGLFATASADDMVRVWRYEIGG